MGSLQYYDGFLPYINTNQPQVYTCLPPAPSLDPDWAVMELISLKL